MKYTEYARSRVPDFHHLERPGMRPGILADRAQISVLLRRLNPAKQPRREAIRDESHTNSIQPSHSGDEESHYGTLGNVNGLMSCRQRHVTRYQLFPRQQIRQHSRASRVE